MAAGRAGSYSQGHHGNLPALPHICAGSPPTSHGTVFPTSSEFHNNNNNNNNNKQLKLQYTCNIYALS